MRVLIVSDLYWPTINGVSTFSRNLAIGLAGLGHDVQVIAPSQVGKPYEETDGNYMVRRTRAVPFAFYQNFRISITPYREVKQIVLDFQPDIIHVQTPLGIAKAAISVGKKYDIPVVATNHSMPENLMDNLKLLAPFSRPINSFLEEYVIRLFKDVEFVTLPTAASIDMFGDRSEDVKAPVRPVSNGIDLSRFTPGKASKELLERYRLPTDRDIVVYAGRLDKEKHLHVLVEAFNQALKKKQLHLLVVGFGNDHDDLCRLAAELGIEDHVTFTGRVSDEDLPQLYRCGQVFVMPSPAELQSIATLEAMASGLPVVAVDAGALYELCHDGKNGYLVAADDHEQMAKKILAVLADPARRKKMSQESLAIAKTHDIKYTLKEFIGIYKEVLANHAKKSR